MTHRILLLVCSFFLITFFGISQTKHPESLEMIKREKTKSPNKLIKEMKNGVLMVRLNTKSKLIKTLREKGHTLDADYFFEKQKTLNLSIMRAFEENFDFCPVYFFASEDSEKIKNKEFTENIFLDSSLKKTQKENIMDENIFIGEFTLIEQLDGEDKIVDYYDGADKKQRSVSGTQMGFEALIIKNDQFEQLRHPFPYYTRTYKTIFFLQRDHDQVVSKMNYRLKKYNNSLKLN